MPSEKTTVVLATRVSPALADAAYKLALAQHITVGDLLREGLLAALLFRADTTVNTKTAYEVFTDSISCQK